MSTYSIAIILTKDFRKVNQYHQNNGFLPAHDGKMLSHL